MTKTAKFSIQMIKKAHFKKLRKKKKNNNEMKLTLQNTVSYNIVSSSVNVKLL